jgi:hypothetical protein
MRCNYQIGIYRATANFPGSWASAAGLPRRCAGELTITAIAGCGGSLEACMRELGPGLSQEEAAKRCTYFVCPAACQHGTGAVYGARGAYAPHSSVCMAALHSGAINEKGGYVVVNYHAGQFKYPGEAMCAALRDALTPKARAAGPKHNDITPLSYQQESRYMFSARRGHFVPTVTLLAKVSCGGVRRARQHRQRSTAAHCCHARPSVADARPRDAHGCQGRDARPVDGPQRKVPSHCRVRREVGQRTASGPLVRGLVEYSPHDSSTRSRYNLSRVAPGNISTWSDKDFCGVSAKTKAQAWYREPVRRAHPAYRGTC